MWLSFTKRIIPEKLYARLQVVDHYLAGERELRLLSHLCDRNRVSLDIGANVGTYTYFMRWYSRRVYAYEPNPELAARLHRLYPDVVIRAMLRFRMRLASCGCAFRFDPDAFCTN